MDTFASHAHSQIYGIVQKDLGQREGKKRKLYSEMMDRYEVDDKDYEIHARYC